MDVMELSRVEHTVLYWWLMDWSRGVPIRITQSD